jgi:hypothetical protein
LKLVHGNVNRLAAELARVSDIEASWLHRWALISTIGASTRIENAVLTDAEIEWVDTALSRRTRNRFRGEQAGHSRQAIKGTASVASRK